MPRIRLATAADSNDAARVVRAVYDEYGFAWDPESYHADLYDLGGHYLAHGCPFWVAEDQGRIVGTAALELFARIPGPFGEVVEHEGRRRVAGTECSLERLYVHPEVRRRGVGLALFEATVAEGRARALGAMEIWSDKRFEAAHRLYRRLGAREAGERICHDPEQSPEWGLVLALD